MHGSRSLASWSIPRKLLLLLLIILLPGSGIIVFSNLTQRERAIKEAENNALLLVMSLAAQQQQIAAGTKLMLSTLAQLPEVKNRDAEACNELFQKLCSKHSSYSFLGAATPDGRIFAGAGPFVPGSSLSEFKYIVDAVSSLDFSVGEFSVDQAVKMPSIRFAYPVQGPYKELIAILVAGINLEEYDNFLAKANPPPGSLLVITDHKGIQLFRFPETEGAGPGRPLPEDSFRQMSGERELGTFSRVSEDGVLRIYSYKRLRLKDGSPPYLYLAVGTSKTQIVRAANLEMLRYLSGLGVIALLVILLVWRSANKLLIRPINQLVDATRQLGNGVMGARTDLPHTSDELGQLARSFDETASLLEIRNIERMRAEAELQKAHGELEDRVKERTAELATANENLKISEARYRTLFESSHDPIFIVRDNRLIDCNQSALKTFGFTGDEIIDSYPCIFSLLVQPDGKYSRADAIEKMAGALSGTPQFFQWTFCRRDGMLFDAEVSLSRFEVMNEVLILGIIRDITSRKIAERELQESALFQQQLIDAIPVPLFYKDKGDRCLGCNKAFEKFLNSSTKEIVGKSASDVMPDEIANVCRETDPALPGDTGVQVCEFSVRLADGSVHDVIFHQAAFPKPDGSAGGLIGVILDITERRKAGEELKRSEERFKILFEFAPDPYYLTDSDGKIIDGNRAAEELTGYAKEELIGKSLFEIDLLPASEIPRAVDDFARVTAGLPTGHDEFTLKRKDGTTVVVEARSFPTVIAGQTLFLGIARDVSERKRTEQALVESQRQLSNIINFLPDATFVIDKEGCVIAWNRTMEEMMGVSAADMLGKGDYEYALPFYGERRPLLIDIVLDPEKEAEVQYLTLERKGGLLAAQSFIQSLKGRPTYLFGTASVLYDSIGKAVGAIESIRDITEHKLMEEAVARAEEKYRDIFENSVTGMYQSTIEGRFLSVNMSFANFLGYDSPEEVLSSVSDIAKLYVHPELRVELLRLMEEHGYVKEFEAEFFRKDNTIVCIAFTIRSVLDKDGNIAYLEGTAQDITKDKLLQAQLNQAQRMEAIGTLAGGIAHDFNNILTPIIGYVELSLNMVPRESDLNRNLGQVLLSANRARDLVRQILTFSRRTEQEQKPVEISLIIKEALKLPGRHYLLQSKSVKISTWMRSIARPCPTRPKFTRCS